MSPVSRTHRKCTISGAVNELETYLEESCQEMDTNPLDYLKINYIDYPTLAKLANKLLSTPATSAPVECIAGIVLGLFCSKLHAWWSTNHGWQLCFPL